MTYEIDLLLEKPRTMHEKVVISISNKRSRPTKGLSHYSAIYTMDLFIQVFNLYPPCCALALRTSLLSSPLFLIRVASSIVTAKDTCNMHIV
jgi:hypothetical protein